MSDKAEPETGSTRPYLVRAIYDWSLDQGLTPQIMVDVTMPMVDVPMGYAQDGKIVLNLHPNSVRGLELGDEYLMFSARFSGRPENIVIPVESVLAVYARENGQGIVFQADGSGITPPSPMPSRRESADVDSREQKPKHGSHLKVIK